MGIEVNVTIMELRGGGGGGGGGGTRTASIIFHSPKNKLVPIILLVLGGFAWVYVPQEN